MGVGFDIEGYISMKLISFYFPQFHPSIENDVFWGPGYSDWVRVSQAVPLFKGHSQPRVPRDFGFYDLRLMDTIEAQAEMAEKFGIYGFCFHYYWFNGTRVLKTPIDNILSSGRPRFPFCFSWANENWTKRWDGSEKNILFEQTYSLEDSRALFRNLLPALFDKRYIKIDDKPLLVVYRTDLIDNLPRIVDMWKEEAVKNGLKGLYLLKSERSDTRDPHEIGFDASLQHPPNFCFRDETKFEGHLDFLTDGAVKDRIFDYDKIKNFYLTRKADFKLFRGVMTGWDNTARYGKNAHIVLNASPEKYRDWLSSAIKWTRENHKEEERIVFINAWNEWSEGMYLEPDQEVSASYLEATKEAFDSVPRVGNFESETAEDRVKSIESNVFSRVTKPFKVLVLKLDHRGDFILSLPAISRVRERLKLVDMDIVVGSWNREIAESLDIFKNIYVFDFFNEKTGLDSGADRERSDDFFRDLGQYDIAIDLRIMPDTRQFLKEVRADIRVGAKTYSDIDDALDVDLDLGSYKSGSIERVNQINNSLQLIELVDMIPLDVVELPMFGANAQTLSGSKKKIGVFPTSGDKVKEWPIENYLSLFKMMENESIVDEVTLYINSASDDLKKLFAGKRNLTIKENLSFDALTNSLQEETLVIAHNSYGSHLASYLGVPVFSIYGGHAAIIEYMPPFGKNFILYSETDCSPCHYGYYRCGLGLECLTLINPETVFCVLKDQLDLAVKKKEAVRHSKAGSGSLFLFRKERLCCDSGMKEAFYKRMTGLEKQNSELEKQCKAIRFKMEFDSLWNSIGWRMTRPLRNMKRLLSGGTLEKYPVVEWGDVKDEEMRNLLNSIVLSGFWKILEPMRKIKRWF